MDKIDIKFIQFFVRSIYNKGLEEYYQVQKSTVSGWRSRGIPKKYIKIFTEKEKSENIYNKLI